MTSTTESTIKAQLRDDLTAAMKARDQVTTGALRMALSAISVAETAGDNLVTLSDTEVVAVLAVEVRKRAEAAEAFAAAGRPERVAEEQAVAAADGATGMKAMGRVVAAARAKAGPTADGAQIAALVKSKLQA
jgi:uncharacterized protein